MAYIADEDYRYVPGWLKRRDGTKMPLPQSQYYYLRYTKRLSHYSIWNRLEVLANLPR